MRVLPGVRIATFNILHGRSPVDDRVDQDRFAESVRALDADVLCLQEVDRNQSRSLHSDLTAAAAEAMGAREHRFVAALSGTPGATWLAATGEEQPDAAATGSRCSAGIRSPAGRCCGCRRCPRARRCGSRGRWRPEWVRDEPRVAVVAELETRDGALRVATTHLSFIPWWNPASCVC